MASTRPSAGDPILEALEWLKTKNRSRASRVLNVGFVLEGDLDPSWLQVRLKYPVFLLV